MEQSEIVVWQDGPNSALDDIKDLARPVRQSLLRLSKEVLVLHPDPSRIEDEQSIEGTQYLMRRAARHEDMSALESQSDGATSTPSTVNYWYVYRPLTPMEVNEYGGSGFFVARVVETQNLSWILQQVQMSDE